MANCAKTREKEERRSRLSDAIQKHPGKVYSTDDIMSMLSVGRACALRDMAAVSETVPGITRTRTSISFIKPLDKNDIFFLTNERKDMDRHPITKNDEGYYDPTIAAVLNKEKAEERKTQAKEPSILDVKIGDIWEVSCSSGEKTEKVIILGVNSYEDTVTCCPFATTLPRYFTKISTKPIKYFKTKHAGLPLSVKVTLQEKLLEYFKIPPKVQIMEKKVEVPVEKIVEKTVEVPAKCEKEYSKAEVDALLAEQKAEIYEECFKILAKRAM